MWRLLAAYSVTLFTVKLPYYHLIEVVIHGINIPVVTIGLLYVKFVFFNRIFLK